MTRIIIKTLILIGFIVFQKESFAQWNENGNALIQTGIFGSTTNWDVLFRTDNVNRMRLMETGTYNVDGYSIDNSGFLYLGLTPSALTNREAQSVLHIDGTGNNQGVPQTLGFRDWMRPGISFTHNSDRMYVGPKAGEAQDETEAVINWSDNDDSFPGLGPDVLRFLFTGQGSGSTLISGDPLDDQDYDGVEVARMTGDAKMGVGPRWTNDILPKRALDVVHRNKDPQFRLTYDGDANDIQGGSHADFQVDEEANTFIKPELNGTRAPLVIGFLNDEEDDPYNPTYLDVAGLTRIRNLPSDPNPDCLILGWSLDIVNGAAPEDQFLNRLDFPDDASLYLDGTGAWTSVGDDCRWQDNSTSTSSNPLELDIYTGFDPGNDCYRGKVGIGVKGPQVAKAEVYMINDELGNFTDPIRNDEVLIGTFSRTSSYVDGNDGSIYVAGVKGQADCLGEAGSTQANIGVHGIGLDSRYICGVFGEGRGLPQSTGGSFGVRGEASGGTNNYGVYGEVFTSGASNYSGYFVGGTFVSSGTSVLLSDQSIKSEINDLTGATETLNSLSPKTYFMQSPENRPIAFEPDLQYGLIAQEVQDVLPALVHETTVPALTDTSGVILDETEVTLLGLQYDQLIPILIAGFNEQSGQVAAQAQIIEDQEETIEELENQLAALSASLGQLQESVAQLNAVVEQNRAKSNDCCEKISNLMGDAGKLGKQGSLEQNVPNPFQETTQIDYNLATNGRVRLIITNELGQPVKTLVNGEMSSGQHSVRWNASNQAPGVHYYTLYFNGDLITKKMIKL